MMVVLLLDAYAVDERWVARSSGLSARMLPSA
jgi:hypothetical protein